MPELDHLQEISLSEMKQLNNSSKVCLAIDGIVYDMTVWVQKHPGGADMIQNVAGTDASDVYHAFHPPNLPHSTSQKILARLPRLAILKESKKTKLQQDFEELRKDVSDRGMYGPCWVYYARVWSWIAFVLAVAWYSTLTAQDTSGAILAGSLSALFLQQSAFVGHDSGHVAVSFSPFWDWVVGLVFGPLFSGISISWWKSSHNTHHIETNQIERDPDIQHLPIFALSEIVIQNGGVYSTYHRRYMALDAVALFFVSNQHILFLPVMMLARLNLYAQGFLFFLGGRYHGSIVAAGVEVAAMMLHHFMLYTAAKSLPSTQLSCVWLFSTIALSGFLNLQIISSHMGLPTLSKTQHEQFKAAPFLQHQLATTTDITTNRLNAWFFGGLERQVCHHVFPRMPRRNLDIAAGLLQDLCKKHDIEYKSVYFSEAVGSVYTCMHDAAMVARKRGQKQD